MGGTGEGNSERSKTVVQYCEEDMVNPFFNRDYPMGTSDPDPEPRREGFTNSVVNYRNVIEEKMAEAEQKAWDALAGYKFWMFGYHAAKWVTYRELLGDKLPNPFTQLVKMAQSNVVRRKRQQ